ncbi:hypothetical protein B0H16DRAFT_102124 [Mycena metata]|uniref:Uncharacterized protein n=1 Tax=Mycena metata TaxID=1033252 RepID=A0AAD7I9H6_9AGAR|nr:hypothetical protein B0H16DRAFT_102124 [Mycena metata]
MYNSNRWQVVKDLSCASVGSFMSLCPVSFCVMHFSPSSCTPWRVHPPLPEHYRGLAPAMHTPDAVVNRGRFTYTVRSLLVPPLKQMRIRRTIFLVTDTNCRVCRYHIRRANNEFYHDGTLNFTEVCSHGGQNGNICTSGSTRHRQATNGNTCLSPSALAFGNFPRARCNHAFRVYPG